MIESNLEYHLRSQWRRSHFGKFGVYAASCAGWDRSSLQSRGLRESSSEVVLFMLLDIRCGQDVWRLCRWMYWVGQKVVFKRYNLCHVEPRCFSTYVALFESLGVGKG